MAVCFGLAATACSDRAPEDRLLQTGERVAATEVEIASLEDRIAELEKRLIDLKTERRKERERLLTLEQRLEARATDVAIFRAVQSALLEDPALQSTAIAVDVEAAVVTLTGSVSRPPLGSQAVAVARNVPGVRQVVTRIGVESDQADD